MRVTRYTPVERVNSTLTGAVERRVLAWLCRRMPRRVTSDMLTFTGVAGAGIACLGYALSPSDPLWLWLAILGLAINWFGDSLDGSLARYHKAERPRYGFFIDHVTDTLNIAFIVIGIGLTSFVRLESGLFVLAAYYVLMVTTMATCVVTGVFRISFKGVGPTEMRLVVLAGTVAALFHTPPAFTLFTLRVTSYDLVMWAAAAVMMVTGVEHVVRIARSLAIEDPPRR